MPDQIIMDELIHGVKEQTRKIVLFEAKIDKIEWKLIKYKTRNISIANCDT